MADALYFVKLPAGRCGQTLNNKVNAVIVVADDLSAEENARAAAAAATSGPDGVWADAEVVGLDATLATPILFTVN